MVAVEEEEEEREMAETVEVKDAIAWEKAETGVATSAAAMM